MVFQCINIRQVPWEVLKTAAFSLGFQHLPRDLVNVNAWKTMFDTYIDRFLSYLDWWLLWQSYMLLAYSGIQGIYTTGIRSMSRVYSFCLSVHPFCLDVVLFISYHLSQIFALKFLRTYIFQAIWYIWFIIGIMIDIGLQCYSPLFPPLPMTSRLRSQT